MAKKDVVTFSALLAPFIIAAAVGVVAFERHDVCWRCLETMPVDYHETLTRYDGTRATFTRWRCKNCNRTTETMKDEF